MRMKKDELLRCLDQVQYGVARQKETVNLSKSFIFQNGSVHTFNDEVLCRIKLPRADKEEKKLSGAVSAERLLNILKKIPAEEVEITQTNGEILVSAGLGCATMRVERLEGQQIPSEQVERPGDNWISLKDPKNQEKAAKFGEALKMAAECAKDKDSSFNLTCIHITPHFVEACDNFQMIRYAIETGLDSPSVMVRRWAVRGLDKVGIDQFAETDNWVHFSNSNTGLIFSCRRFVEDYHDLSAYFQVKGEDVPLPNKMEPVIDRAQEFSQEMADASRVKVLIRPGKAVISGIGITGKWEEVVTLDEYKGREYAFLIAPTLLINLVKRHECAQLTQGALIVKGDNWTYTAHLVNPEDVEYAQDERQEETEEDEE